MTTVPTNDLEILQSWIGKQQTVAESISAAHCQRLQHTLDRTEALATGDRLPTLWHFITHVGSTPHRAMGADGHPERGGFLPPVALPRRMWAGGRVRFISPIAIGDEVTKTSTIEDVALKSGRSGELCFVTVRHQLSVDGTLCIDEEQDLVFREEPAPDAPTPQPKPAPTEADWSETVDPSEVMLFRYSALTFNAHRIHYDRDYARDVEGYAGLVVHGPLTATLLADLAERAVGRPLATFSFRGMAPLFDTAPFTINGRAAADTAELWAATPEGGMAMKVDVTFA